MPPTRQSDLGPLARLSGLATVLGLLLLVLLDLDRALPPPPLATSPDHLAAGWSRWLTEVGAPGALMSGVRLLGVALTGYLLVVVTVELLGRATGLCRLQSFGDLISTPLARRLVGGIAGLGLAASLGAVGSALPASADTIAMRAPSASPAARGDGDVPVMRALDPDPTNRPAGVPDVPVMRSLDADAAAVPSPPTTAPATTPTTPTTPTTVAPTVATPSDAGGTTGPSSPPMASPTPGDRWVIQPGDHLWGVARRTLAGSWSRPPTDGEVARYLDRLIEANLAVLVVPGDADLVIAGQVFALPPAPAA